MTTELNKNNPTEATEPTIQTTVKKMQSHFASTGAYRADDLCRVIGDQRNGVGFVMQDSFVMSARKHR